MRQPAHIRFFATILLICQLNSTFPLAYAVAVQPEGEVRFDDPLVRTPANVTVNRRTTPVAAPERSSLDPFSAQPTADEVFRARIFQEPFVAVGAEPSSVETQALAEAIRSYIADSTAGVAPFTEFLDRYPTSAWAPSIRLNLGLHWFARGNYTPAMNAYQDAWAQAKSASDSSSKAIADRAVAELLQMNARLGRSDVLETLFAEIGDREFTGTATELVSGARQGLALMKERPEDAFRCGPAALDRILARARQDAGFNDVLMSSRSTAKGISLTEVWKLSQQVGLKLQMARRSSGAVLISPAVVHWKLGHFAALFAEGDLYRLEDPTFGADTLATEATVNEEASGYFLVPEGPLPSGWSRVEEAEGSTVWGKGNTTTNDPEATRPDDQKTCIEPSNGMAVASAHLMVVSLNLMDTPVGYAPPRGPAVYFTATYNQREASQPTTIDYSHLGTKWVHNWLSFIDEATVPSSGSAQLSATVRLPGGGSEGYKTSQMSVNPLVYPYSFQPSMVSRSLLTKESSDVFTLTQGDGSKMVYGHKTGLASPYRYFLTEIVDPFGNALLLEYDGQNRLISVTDSLAQVTTLSYELSGSPLKITKVTDPFGRFATFEYDSSGRLETITDVLGLESQFTYQGTSDFISALTTPYGTSTFSYGEGTAGGRNRWLEMTDPAGRKERIEFRDDWAGLPGAGPMPTGMNCTGSYQNFRNTLYWDKKATQQSSSYSPSVAHIYHWLHTSINQTSAHLENEKAPNENRVWYNYEGQTSSIFEGTSGRRTKVGRVLDDGTTQLYQFEYNTFGKVTKAIDPLGRETTSIYAPNGLDLVEVRQKTGTSGEYEVLQAATYNAQHLPLSVSDAAGQVTTFTYNTSGQPLTATNAKSEATTFGYDIDGYITSVDGPLAGTSDSTVFAYDGYGRVRTVTDTDGFTVTTDYDVFDRPTVITYPDTTYEQIVYDRLDAVRFRDRRNRWSESTYNNVRQLSVSRDALNRVTTYQWCSCGSLATLTDPMGKITSWGYDGQGRLTSKTAHDGTAVTYAYETTTSRLKSSTDAKGQVTHYEYFKDNALKQVSYTNTNVPTATVSYTYEPYYRRISTMTDGVGSTAYAYNPIPTTPTLGAGRLVSIDGPFANDTITYTYDELGRTLTRSINGTANFSEVAYDVLGRLESQTNGLGAFDYTYVGATSRLAAIDYPNGQRTNYAYFGTAGDHRLESIENLKPGGANLSTFGYTYDANGMIQTWSRQIDAATAVTASFKYDSVNQLIEAAMPQGYSLPLKDYVYRYDKSGNRTSEQIGNTVAAASHDAVNQLKTLSATGPIRFSGTLNEPADVTVDGQPAQVDGSNAFQADFVLAPGTHQVVVAATDGSHNTTTQTYEVVVGSSGAERTLVYDLNGNLLDDDDGRTFTWDAVNRLVKITQGTDEIEFVYNGNGERVQEKLNGTEVKRWVWTGGAQPAEERDAANTVTKQFHAHGVREGSVSYYYTTDHLGSIREMTDNAGAVVARYDYDPYGRMTKVSGSLEADFGFTGFYRHVPSGLSLTLYRAYDSEVGRWLSRDPLGEDGGINLYGYVGNNPVNAIDPLGLDWLDTASDFSAGFGDFISFGLTKKARQWMGTDDVVNKCSGAYGAGEWAGFGAGLLMGGAHAGRTAIAQMGKAGSLATRLGRGVGRLFYDGRSWGSVRSTYSQAVGGLKAIGQSLHHAFAPQRWGVFQGLQNAGLNYFQISAGLNGWMNGSTAARTAVEWLFKAGAAGAVMAEASVAQGPPSGEGSGDKCGCK